MHISLGAFGHTLTLNVSLTADETETYDEEKPTHGGGSGGNFEILIQDQPLEYVTGDDWYEEENCFGFQKKPPW